jgi:hypothetical protein
MRGLDEIQRAVALGVCLEDRVASAVENDRAHDPMRGMTADHEVQPVEATEPDVGDHQFR